MCIFLLQVLSDVTWPNIIRNCTNEIISGARCIAGDWLSFSAQLLNRVFFEEEEVFFLI